MTTQQSFLRCTEIIKVGVMELSVPKENASCIVFGDNHDAVNCYQLCLSYFGRCASNNFSGDEKYDVGILFSPMNSHTLTKIMADGAIVIDCVPIPLRDSTDICANEHFRRLRIVCMADKMV